MANSERIPSDEPGRRSGEGAGSVLPHLQRQAQTQVQTHTKPQPPTEPRHNKSD